MKILVTGGAGFIGGHLSIYLKNKGFDVFVIDNLERSSMLSALRENDVKIIVGDLRSAIEFPKADVIVHAAAYIDVAESLEKPYDYIVNNTAVTARVARRAYEDGSLIIYISSAAVYGAPLYLPIDEEHPKNPLSPYGLSKLMGEYIVEFYSKRFGLHSTILRLFNVYGPCQSSAYSGVITRFTKRVKAGLPPVIYGDGLQTRDFIHVRDVVRFIEIIIEKLIQGVYNVGSGRAISIKELAYLVLELAGLRYEPVYEPPRIGDIVHSVADIKKARSLGWKPIIELHDGIRELLNSEKCIY